MLRPIFPPLLAAAAGLITFGGSGHASAEEPVSHEQCLAAHENAQVTRAEGNLIGAKQALLTCSRSDCPEIVRRDCASWYPEVDREIPSLVVAVRIGERDVFDATISVDGTPYPEALDGKEIVLNPGRHKVRLVREGQEPIEKEVLLARGEEGRRVTFELEDPDAKPLTVAPIGPSEKPKESAPAEAPKERPIPTVTYVLAGVSVAAFATGATFGILGISEKNGLDCAPFCSADEKASVDAKLLTADIAYGVGLAAGIGAVITYFLRPEVDATGPQVSAAVSKNGAGLLIGGAF